MFKFNTHPGAVTVTDGIQIAFEFLQTSWRKWLPMVVVIAACSFVLFALIYSLGNSLEFDDYTNRLAWGPGAAGKVGGIVVVGLLYVAVTIVGSWVFAAAAIGGLRNRPLTFSFVVGRGLLTVAAGIVIAIVSIVAFIAAVVVIAVAVATVPVVGVVLMVTAIFGAIPVGLYLAIRMIFYSLAIFDGFGPIEGIKESWRLSQRSVLRLAGWGLMAGVISLGFGIVGNLVSLPFAVALQPLGQAVSSFITTTGSCLVVFMMAVLYESQRTRFDPSLYQFTPAPGYPGPYAAGPGPYAAGPNPYAPGPGYPGPNPAWPAYPQGQGGAPGWVDPNAPVWPGYPPAYPGTPPVWGQNPDGGPGWKPPESDEPPPTSLGPTDPPASS